jgi:integrase
MSIYKRDEVCWFTFTHQGKRIQKSAKTRNRRLAEKRERSYRTALENGEFGIKEPTSKQKNVTVSALLDRLEQHYRSDGKLSPQNLSALAVARRAFGAKLSDSLTKQDLDRYIEKRIDQGAKNATINRILEKVARAYRLAKLEPPEIQHLSEKNNVRRGFFERAEFDAVASHLPPDVADFAYFGYLSAWRKSEISSLRWADVEADVEGDIIHLRAEDSKNGEGRSIPVAGELLALLERRRKARIVETPPGERLAEWIFHRDGRRIVEFRKAWKTACKRAGCSKLFHDLRRTAVRDLIRSGVPQSVAMDISGHKTISMFKRYNITDKRDKAAAIKRLAEYHQSAAKKVVAMAVQ